MIRVLAASVLLASAFIVAVPSVAGAAVFEGADRDGDWTNDLGDTCPEDFSTGSDLDLDGVGDECDPTPTSPDFDEARVVLYLKDQFGDAVGQVLAHHRFVVTHVASPPTILEGDAAAAYSFGYISFLGPGETATITWTLLELPTGCTAPPVDTVSAVSRSTPGLSYSIQEFTCDDREGDGLSAPNEARWFTSDEDPDSDDDGLSDGDEVHTHLTDPLDLDSDDDLLSDGDEIDQGSDPLDPGSPGTDPDCDGITASDVEGDKPNYRDASNLASFPNDDAVCDAVWVPTLDDGFVPQGLALTGDGSALVSGYNGDAVPTTCRVVRVDLTTGLLTGRYDFAAGCRHGGGIEFDSAGHVWLVDTNKIFALDYATLFTPGSDPIEHKVRPSGFKGSMAAKGADGSTLWIGDFDASEMFEFQVSDLLAGKTIEEAARIDVIDIPTSPQGAAFHGPGLWVSSSKSTCGVLHDGSDRLGFSPGSEGIEFDADDTLWVVSEAGASKYPGSPLFPVVASFDVDVMDEGPKLRCALVGQ